MDHSLGALLAQKNDDGHEQAIYYLSRTLIGVGSRYNLIEKECQTLVGQTIHVIFRVNHLCLLVTKPGSLNKIN